MGRLAGAGTGMSLTPLPTSSARHDLLCVSSGLASGVLKSGVSAKRSECPSLLLLTVHLFALSLKRLNVTMWYVLRSRHNGSEPGGFTHT